jgi:hypothetical protein
MDDEIQWLSDLSDVQLAWMEVQTVDKDLDDSARRIYCVGCHMVLEVIHGNYSYLRLKLCGECQRECFEIASSFYYRHWSIEWVEKIIEVIGRRYEYAGEQLPDHIKKSWRSRAVGHDQAVKPNKASISELIKGIDLTNYGQALSQGMAGGIVSHTVIPIQLPPGTAIIGGLAAGTQSIQLAAQAFQTITQVAAVVGKAFDEVKEAVENAVRSFTISMQEATKSVTSIISMLEGSGLLEPYVYVKPSSGSKSKGSVAVLLWLRLLKFWGSRMEATQALKVAPFPVRCRSPPQLWHQRLGNVGHPKFLTFFLNSGDNITWNHLRFQLVFSTFIYPKTRCNTSQ